MHASLLQRINSCNHELSQLRTSTEIEAQEAQGDQQQAFQRQAQTQAHTPEAERARLVFCRAQAQRWAAVYERAMMPADARRSAFFTQRGGETGMLELARAQRPGHAVCDSAVIAAGQDVAATEQGMQDARDQHLRTGFGAPAADSCHDLAAAHTAGSGGTSATQPSILERFPEAGDLLLVRPPPRSMASALEAQPKSTAGPASEGKLF